MRVSITDVPLAIVAYLSMTKAKAAVLPPGGVDNPAGIQEYTYTVIDTQDPVGGPFLIGDYFVVGAGGRTLNDGSSHTIGLSVGISVDLGLDLKVIASIADISASVSLETQTGISQGAQKNCPDGPWLCTLIVLPAMVQVSGMQIPLSAEWTLNRSLGKPYTVQYLKTDGDGLGGVEVDI